VSVLAVVGMKREAQLVARYAAAVTPQRLAAATDVTAILSVGIAGALAPDLEVGDTLIAERVVTANQAFETDAKWTARLAAALPEARIGAILGRDRIADSADVKALLRDATGADAVDMESHLAARAALVRGVPFAALRVVSDGAERSLPPAVLVAMTPDGGVALGRVLAALLRRPGQTGSLIRTARESGRAFRALARNLEMIGTGLRAP
jgi:adenosylhomocysteine nucleosidase